MNLKYMAQFIAERRKKLGYTQERLGAEIGVSAKAVSKWERGLSFPDIALLDDLAAILKCSVYDLTKGGFPSNEVKKQGKPVAPGKSDSDNTKEDSAICFDYDSNRIVSEFLMGSNLEHTRNCIHRGLSAQMLENRKFAGKPWINGCANGWKAVGEKAFFGFGEAYTRHSDDYYMKRKLERNSQQIISFEGGNKCGISQDGLCVEKGKKYTFSLAVKVVQECKLNVAITDQSGHVLCEGLIKIEKNDDFIEKEIVLSSVGGCDNAVLSITFCGVNTVYIGAVSMMPEDNFHGMRKDVINLMKEMGISILRWPGGNFAGEYNWKDGLMSSNMRAPFESYLQIETQPQSMGYDFHEINTDDFIMLCREIGAEPFITINPTWNTPEMSAQWVEYCNGDETTEYGKIRISRGYKEPYNVKFWSLGNEFGYGHMEGPNGPYEYSKMVRRHAEAMLKVTPDLNFCSSGPYPNAEWAEESAKALSNVAKYVSLHHYINYPDFTSPDKYKEEYDKFIENTSAVKELSKRLREELQDEKIRISFDEWNSWYAWYRPESVCDGIFAATVLHKLISEMDKSGIDVVCHFEAVNEGAVIVDQKSAKLTPMGEVFAVMKHHKCGKLLFANDSVVATEHSGKIVVSIINASYDKDREYKIPVCGNEANGILYHSDSVLPHSTFSQKEIIFDRKSNEYVIKMPPHSIALVIQTNY